MSINSFVYILFCCWISICSIAYAEQKHIVDHVDEIIVDPQLSLSDLVSQTLEKYPDYSLIAAMQKEANALNQRGSHWFAGASTASMYYKDDFVGTDTGAYEIEGAIEVPLWNWGQRDAGLQLAEQAGLSAENKAKAINLQVAGLVRGSLWNMELANIRHKMAEKNLYLTEKLLNTIQLRVKLGDLPKTDFLLAENEVLQKKIELVYAEAELMHTRKRFTFLTQSNKIPQKINERQSGLEGIAESHPALAAVNANVAKQKANVDWVKAEGSGQTTLALGGNMDKPSRIERTKDSLILSISIPFGGKDYAAPDIANAERQYTEAVIEKKQLYRQLLEQAHEAKHELEVERVQLKIAIKMKQYAEQHSKMAKLSFEAGEINLMDFLRVQARSQSADKQAEESTVRLQRDIALYNQAVGVTP
ncbi:MAG: TolC family protein [Methylococcales bacterium]